ncbi:protein Mis18-alpha isoform X1 [Brienomyrus brachyistius]|uniref:protein Mis18-alpha isoform X1 n=1 Tax=Brienomyrus brachyistius TaxID=42636 RepID=UPI0020B40694|nr:protein Mis18-alpha isoform X1 [Brienomyrus brachyistius]
MAGEGRYSLRNTTYTSESMTDEEPTMTEFEPGNKGTKDDGSDPPVVFQCARCRLPIGDSLAWAGSEDEQNQILLKRTTDNVVISSEPYVSRTQVESGCLVVNISCRGCSAGLGRVYTSTPKSLDYKRSLFCLDVGTVDCYILGSANQTMLLDPEECPVTLEYREAVDFQITQIKALTLSVGQRLMEIEAQLQDKK